MSQPMPASPSAGQPMGGAPMKKRSPAAKILIILGAVILGLSLIAGIVVAAVGFTGVVGGASRLEVLANGSGTYTAEADEVLQLYAPEGQAPPTCTVTGPDGSTPGPGTRQTSTLGTNDANWASFDSFSTTEAGEYTIDCSGGPVAVGPPVSMGGIFAGVGGVLLAVFGGMLGLLLLIIGIVLRVMGKKKA